VSPTSRDEKNEIRVSGSQDRHRRLAVTPEHDRTRIDLSAAAACRPGKPCSEARAGRLRHNHLQQLDKAGKLAGQPPVVLAYGQGGPMSATNAASTASASRTLAKTGDLLIGAVLSVASYGQPLGPGVALAYDWQVIGSTMVTISSPRSFATSGIFRLLVADVVTCRCGGTRKAQLLGRSRGNRPST
jgi:hypothetical protein